jgi:cell wall-associated NlpC family hydrolase
VIALDRTTNPDTSLLILVCVCFILAVYAVSRLRAIRFVRTMTDRLERLEDELGMKKSPATRQLNNSLRTALAAAVLLFGLAVYLLLTHSPEERTQDISKLRDEMVRYAYKYRGVPYQWGGDYPETGVDCSGYARCMLQEFDLLPDGDFGAQALFDHFREYRTRRMQPGNLIFFGDNDSSITHVGILVDHMRMIDASGGSSLSGTLATALSRDAKVGVTMIESRKNPAAVVDPFAVLAGEDYWSTVKSEDSAWSEHILLHSMIRAGDADLSGEVDLADIICLIDHVFVDAAAPNPPFSGDADCSGEVDSEDIVYLTAYVLSGGAWPCDVHGRLGEMLGILAKPD